MPLWDYVEEKDTSYKGAAHTRVDRREKRKKNENKENKGEKVGIELCHYT